MSACEAYDAAFLSLRTFQSEKGSRASLIRRNAITERSARKEDLIFCQRQGVSRPYEEVRGLSDCLVTDSDDRYGEHISGIWASSFMERRCE